MNSEPASGMRLVSPRCLKSLLDEVALPTRDSMWNGSPFAAWTSKMPDAAYGYRDLREAADSDSWNSGPYCGAICSFRPTIRHT